MAADVWNMACGATKETSGPNCPWNIAGDEGTGRDFDFGAGAIIAKGADGKDVVLAGQKSGDTWALDADTGKLLWNVRFGEGTRSAVCTGASRPMANVCSRRSTIRSSTARERRHDPAYSPSISRPASRRGVTTPNRTARASAANWSRTAQKYGFSAAPLTIDGAVVAATLGGEVMIFDGKEASC